MGRNCGECKTRAAGARLDDPPGDIESKYTQARPHGGRITGKADNGICGAHV